MWWFNKQFLVKFANIISWPKVFQNHGHCLKRTISVNIVGWHLDLDDPCIGKVWHKSGPKQWRHQATQRQQYQAALAAGGKYERILSSSEHRFGITCATKEVRREASTPTLGSLQDDPKCQLSVESCFGQCLGRMSKVEEFNSRGADWKAPTVDTAVQHIPHFR